MDFKAALVKSENQVQPQYCTTEYYFILLYITKFSSALHTTEHSPVQAKVRALRGEIESFALQFRLPGQEVL